MKNNKNFTINKSRLIGKVELSGAKNSALRLLAASLLTNEPVQINNFPSGLLDIQIHLKMLNVLGKQYSVEKNTITIAKERGALNTTLEWHERSIRNTLLILGALTTRFGEGRVPFARRLQTR